MTPLHRPLVRWFGGKWHMAPWIASCMPAHTTYVEPFGGGASVLLRKPRSPVEVLGEVDPDLVALYKIVAHPRFHVLLGRMAAEVPYDIASVEALPAVAWSDVLGRALRPVVRGALTRSGAICRGSGKFAGFRRPEKSPHRDTSPADDWSSWPKILPAAHARLQDVSIEQAPAIEVMLRHDGPTTVHYVDPPYLPSARRAPWLGYKHDMSEADHVELLAVLRSLTGAVLLSGYDCPLYREGLPGWSRLDRTSIDAGGGTRVESLWLNPAAAAGSPALRQLNLFDATAALAA